MRFKGTLCKALGVPYIRMNHTGLHNNIRHILYSTSERQTQDKHENRYRGLKVDRGLLHDSMGDNIMLATTTTFRLRVAPTPRGDQLLCINFPIKSFVDRVNAKATFVGLAVIQEI